MLYLYEDEAEKLGEGNGERKGRKKVEERNKEHEGMEERKESKRIGSDECRKGKKEIKDKRKGNG